MRLFTKGNDLVGASGGISRRADWSITCSNSQAHVSSVTHYLAAFARKSPELHNK